MIRALRKYEKNRGDKAQLRSDLVACSGVLKIEGFKVGFAEVKRDPEVSQPEGICRSFYLALPDAVCESQ